MLKHATASLCVVLLGTSLAQQTGKELLRNIPGGFMNTGEYSDLPPVEQYGYAMGFVNGMMASGNLGADISKLETLNGCTEGMQAKQLAAVLDKYVKEHPEVWHQTL